MHYNQKKLMAAKSKRVELLQEVIGQKHGLEIAKLFLPTNIIFRRYRKMITDKINDLSELITMIMRLNIADDDLSYVNMPITSEGEFIKYMMQYSDSLSSGRAYTNGDIVAKVDDYLELLQDILTQEG